MPHSFDIELKQSAKVLIGKLKDVAQKSGWSFQGDTNSGSFSGDGVVGEYVCEGENLHITLLDKPFIAPWSLVENRLRDRIG